MAVRDEQDRLGRVADRALGETRLIVVDQRDEVAAGDVAVVDDGEPVAVEVQADIGNFAGRNRRANCPSIQHPRQREIVDVAGGAGDFVEPLLARNIAANGLHPAAPIHRPIIARNRCRLRIARAVEQFGPTSSVEMKRGRVSPASGGPLDPLLNQSDNRALLGAQPG